MTSSRRVAWSEGMFLRPATFPAAGTVSGKRARTPDHASASARLGHHPDIGERGSSGGRQVRPAQPDGGHARRHGRQRPGRRRTAAPHRHPARYARRRRLSHAAAAPARRPEFMRAASATGAVRYAVAEQEAIDSFSASRNAEAIDTAQPNLRLGISTEQTDGRVLLSLARILERRDQLVVLDRALFPPRWFWRRIRRWPESWRTSAAVRRRAPTSWPSGHRQDRGGNRDADQLLHAASAQPLDAAVQSICGPARDTIPRRSMRRSCRWRARWRRSARRRGAPVFPDYNHLDLRRCFAPVIDFLMNAFSIQFSQAAVQLDIEMPQPGAYICPIRDRNLFRTATIFIAVSARRPPQRNRRALPGADQDRLGDADARTGAGRGRRHRDPARDHAAAAEMPAFRELTYFQLDQSDRNGAISPRPPRPWALRSPATPPEKLKLEAWAVKRAGG